MKNELYARVLAHLQELNYPEGLAGIVRDSLASIDRTQRAGNVYAGAKTWAMGGGGAISYAEQRELLNEWYKGTKYEGREYSDDKVFAQYCHLVAQAMTKWAKGKL
jgi:hypothetical protein